MRNSGQSCNAPTRMFVPAEQHDEALAIAKEVGRADQGRRSAAAETPRSARSSASRSTTRSSGLIEAGIEEGATLVTGGPGRPEGLEPRLLCAPDRVRQRHDDMTIAREEIFGPVLSILPYENEDQASSWRTTPLRPGGLCAVGRLAHARRVAAEMRAGKVHLNGRRATWRRRSAATSSPATAANRASTASRSSSRSRRCSATSRPDGEGGPQG